MSLRMRQNAMAVMDLPASDVAPRTIIALPLLGDAMRSGWIDQ